MRSPHFRRLLRNRPALILGTAVAVAAAGLAGPSYAAPPAEPYISEIHYDNASTDTGEFIEVQVPAGTSSAGMELVLYNGNGGGKYGTFELTAVTPPGDEPAVTVLERPSNGIQNGSPDGIALVDASGTVLEFLSYEGTFTAVDGPAGGTTSTDIGVSEGGSDPAGWSLSRTYDAATDALAWHGPAPESKGTVNPAAGSEPEPEPEPEPSPLCDVTPTHEIGAVQGSGDETPLRGQQVTVRGTVVGDLPGFDGFHLQDPDGDGDAATSDGIFVYSPVPVDLGDTVVVQGEAGEYFGQTQITSWEDVAVCGSAPDLPARAALDLPANDAEREPFEGMLVEPIDELTVSEVYDLTRYGELTLSEGGLLVQPTELARPGPEAESIVENNRLRRIVLDDGLSSGVSPSTAPYLTPSTPVRVGDVLDFTEPVVLGYGFGQWRLQPADGTADGVFAPQDTRSATPDAVGGDVQVGAFNVLNYFLTFEEPGRGARSAEQLELQAGKIVPAIRALDADILTLMEIEDTDSTGYSPGNADAALADLVRRLNEAAGEDVWSYVPMPEELYGVDRDVIRNGIIYRHDVVETIGEPVGLVDESVWDNAREPIAQTFAFDGDVFTVVANHFKSKSPGDPTGDNVDNVDTGDGQGAWNGDRTRQAESLVGFADALRIATGDPDVLLMGDFNAYSQEDPIVALRDAGYTDLGTELDPGGYSYVFDDQSGSLDHAMASAALVGKVTDLTHWNINAVESFAYQYYGAWDLYAPNPYRSSDHDPLLLGIDVAEQCDGLVPTIVGTPGDDEIEVGAGEHVIMGLGGNDVILGGDGEDVVCGGAGDDQLNGQVGDDVLLGGFGHDVVDGGIGDDRLVGGPGQDDLRQGGGEGVEEQDGRAS